MLQASLSDAEPWDEGTGAVVAELLTTGYALSVRAAGATRAAELRAELEAQLDSPQVTGAVAVLREQRLGIALIATRRLGFERIEVDLGEGALSRSQLALGVLDRMRHIEIRADAGAPPPAALRSARSSGELELWLGGGAVMASGLSSPLSWVSVSGALLLAEPLGLEVSLGLSPFGTRISTSAGSLLVKAEQATFFATFNPLARRQLGLVLGLGGGAMLVREEASPGPGYVGFDETANVGVVGARARAFARWGQVSFILSVDPALLVPAASVDVAGETKLGVGRPWFTATAGVGWAP